ncbi:hypothetical protein V8B55DRAFT_1451236 [Mucor lusitanicus]
MQATLIILAVVAALLLVFTHQVSSASLIGETKAIHKKRLVAGVADVADGVVDAVPLSDIGNGIDAAVKDEVERIGQRL